LTIWPRLTPNRRDGLLIALLCMGLCYLIVTLPFSGERIARTADNAWYLNRGDLLWRGVFEGAFVYNAGYPLLVGALNAITRELPAAGIVVNWLAVSALLIGMYTLGRLLYNRPIAWLALLVIGTNGALFRSARLMQTFILFQAVVVWCVVVTLILTRRQGRGWALALGGLTAFALYTRLEGVAYGALIGLAAVSIYRTGYDGRRTLSLALMSGGVFALALVFYAAVLLSNADVGGGAAFSLFALLRQTPLPWDELSRRWTDALRAIVGNWPVWAWWAALAGCIWAAPRWRAGNWLCAGLIGFNLLYLFLLSTWPAPRYANHFLPFFALLFAAAVWQFYRRWPRLWIGVPLAVVAIGLPGIRQLQNFSQLPRLSYWDYASAQEARALDDWLAGQGWADTEVYTLCQAMLPFTRGNFHLIYRLSVRAGADTQWPDAPERLLATIRQSDNLFMTCAERPEYPDWRAYLENPAGYAERLAEVGRVGDYVFYRVVRAP
jgi:hypothetical protein